MDKILIIEDEKAIRNLYTEMLKSEKYKVFEAENGLVGYALAVKEKPNMILLDFRLPDINGLEVLKLIKKNSELDIPVLIITNYIRDIDKQEVFAQGVKEILLKYEITPAILLEKINKYLGR